MLENPDQIPIDAPPMGSQWTHWKGKTATVIAVGHHSETGEICVCYYEDTGVYIRPLSMWSDEASPGITRFVRKE